MPEFPSYSSDVICLFNLNQMNPAEIPAFKRAILDRVDQLVIQMLIACYF